MARAHVKEEGCVVCVCVVSWRAISRVRCLCESLPSIVSSLLDNASLHAASRPPPHVASISLFSAILTQHTQAMNRQDVHLAIFVLFLPFCAAASSSLHLCFIPPPLLHLSSYPFPLAQPQAGVASGGIDARRNEDDNEKPSCSNTRAPPPLFLIHLTALPHHTYLPENE